MGVWGSGCGSVLRLGFAAEGDFVAEVAELADEPADVAGVIALAFVVIGAEVLVAGSGAGWQGVEDLHLGVGGGDDGFGLAALAGDLPVPGAFAGLGFTGGDGGLAEDGGDVLVAAFVPSLAVAGAGLLVQRGAPAPGGQVTAGGEPGHVGAGLGDDVLGGAPCPAGHRLGLLQLLLIGG